MPQIIRRHSIIVGVSSLLALLLSVRLLLPLVIAVAGERLGSQHLPWSVAIEPPQIVLNQLEITFPEILLTAQQGESLEIRDLRLDLNGLGLIKGTIAVDSITAKTILFPMEWGEQQEAKVIGISLEELSHFFSSPSQASPAASKEESKPLVVKVMELKIESLLLKAPMSGYDRELTIRNLNLFNTEMIGQEFQTDFDLSLLADQSRIDLSGIIRHPQGPSKILVNSSLVFNQYFDPLLRVAIPKLKSIAGHLESELSLRVGPQEQQALIEQGSLAVTVQLDEQEISASFDELSSNLLHHRGTKKETWLVSDLKAARILYDNPAQESKIRVQQLSLDKLKSTIDSPKHHLDVTNLAADGLILEIDPDLSDADKEVSIHFPKIELDQDESNDQSQLMVRIGDHGSIKGSVNGSKDGFRDTKVDIKAVDLIAFSGLLRQIIGYQIDRGQINGQLTLKESQTRELDGQLELNLRKLELNDTNANGTPIASKLGLPLASALSLIQDEDSNIELDFPIAGNSESPEFQLSHFLGKKLGLILLDQIAGAVGKSLITQMLPVLAQNVPMNPLMAYSLLKKGVKIVQEFNLEPIYFSPQENRPTAESLKVLDSLAARLQRSKDLTLNFCTEGQQIEEQDKSLAEAQARLKYIKDYLINQKQVSPDQIIACAPRIATQFIPGNLPVRITL